MAKNTKKNDKGPAGNSAPKNNPIELPTIKRQSGGGNGGGGISVRDAIRAAGSNGNIGKKELLKIAKKADVDTDQVIRQLDKVNDRRIDNSKASIGLGSAAYNSLLKTPTSRLIMGKTMTELGLKDRYANFGTGAIGTAIMQGKDTSKITSGNGGGTTSQIIAGTGKIPKGQQVIGTYNSTPQLQIKPQNNVNAGYYEAGYATTPAAAAATTSETLAPTDTSTSTTNDTVTPTTSTPTATPTATAEDKLDPIALNSGTGSSVDGGATSFRRKRSSARSSGLTTRGTGQFRNSLKVGSASGVNIGM